MKTINSEKADCKHDCYHYIKLLVFFSCLFANTLTQAEECLLAKQLNDPYIRAEYEAVIAENRTNDTNRDVEDMYGNIQPASFSEIPSFADHDINNRLDQISLECIACHDGVLAREAKHRIFTENQPRLKSRETISGGHPIGMDYEQYTWRKDYLPVGILPADMVLMNGKVTCVTCHNILGKKVMYLAVDNSSSRLCFSCHIK